MKFKGLKLAIAMVFVFAYSNANAQTKTKPSKEDTFKKMDTNADGFLSKEEFTAGMEGKKKKRTKALDVDKFFTRQDINNDNMLDLNEYITKQKGGKKD